MGEVRYGYRILAGKSEAESLYWKHKSIWMYKIKVDLGKIVL
jgi:hypothetical protein